ncbi:MAG: hypothetical protein HC880_11350 [Bacteroidia bacterium]|nr:hypothetical protein [Bacteroidia bacterium]
MPVPTSHAEPGTFTVDGKIIVIGGERGDRPYSHVMAYDPKIDQWATIDHVRNAQGDTVRLLAPSAKVVGNKLIVSHGFSGGTSSQSFRNQTYIKAFNRASEFNLGFNPDTIRVTLPYGNNQKNESAWLFTSEGKTPYTLDLTNFPSWLSLTRDDEQFVDESTVAFQFQIRGEGLPPATYSYHLKANAPNYTSADLHIQLVVEPVDGVEVPTPPILLLATPISSTEVRLAWQPQFTGEDFYEVYRAVLPDGNFIKIAQTAEPIWTDSGLDPNVKYAYKVRAVNAGGLSEFSNTLDASPLPFPPEKPDSLFAEALSSDEIQLTWKSALDNEDSFEIYRAFFVDGQYEQIGESSEESFIDTGLFANTLYFYQVRGVNVSGMSEFSEIASDTTLVAPPGTPQSPEATALSESEIQIIWQNQENVAHFELYRSLANDANFIKIKQTSDTLFTDTGLAANTAYSYRIKAFNQGGASAFSDTTQATTLPGTTTPLEDIVIAREIKIYPNPSRDIYQVEFAASGTGPISLRVYNILGQQVASLQAEKMAERASYQITE